MFYLEILFFEMGFVHDNMFVIFEFFVFYKYARPRIIFISYQYKILVNFLLSFFLFYMVRLPGFTFDFGFRLINIINICNTYVKCESIPGDPIEVMVFKNAVIIFVYC